MPCFETVETWREIRMFRVGREYREAVEQAIHRRQSLIAAGALFVKDAIEAVSQRFFAQPGKGATLFTGVKDVVGGAQRTARRNVQIGLGDEVSILGKIDLIVGLRIKLFAQI